MFFKKFICAAVSIAAAFSMLPSGTVCSAEEDSKLIALTFDDGPNTTTTNEILDLLEQYNAKASFFLIGDNINDESAVSVKRAYDMGCEINNHSRTHSNMSSMSDEDIKAEIEYVDEWVEKITGEPTKFFRPPFIDTSQSMYDAIDLPFICGIDCQDYMENVTAEARAEYILNGARDGVIVLLHDASGNSQTVDALKIAMPQLIEQGYEFVTLTELFERQGETPKDNLLYTYVTKYPCKDYEVSRNLFSGLAEGDQSNSVWQEVGVLDKEELEALGDSFAIEIECSGMNSPVLALQKWSGTAIWQTVQPEYYNGEKACFMAEDILPVLESLNVGFTDLDKVSILPFSGSMTVTKIDLLVRSTSSEDSVVGDVNNDKTLSVADLVAMQKYLIGNVVPENIKAGDFDKNETIDVFDLIMMRKAIIEIL